MRRVVPLLGFAAALVACSDTLPVEHPRSSTPRFSVADNAVNRYVIQLSNSSNAEEFTRAVTSLGGSVVAVHQRAGFAVVEGLTGAGAASLGRQRGVQAVEPDLVAQVVDPASQWIGAMPLEGANVDAESQANPATAILFGLQWNQRAIGSPAAWAAGRLGSPSVKVAILDSGIDDTWPDFTARGGTANPATALVDKTRSASFLPTVGTCLDPSDHELINGRAAFTLPSGAICPALLAFFPGKPAWSDLNGHGTLTAGIVSSNGFAFAGVTSKVTLMAVKVLNARGNGSFSSILQGVVYATDNGADVINMSLGSVFLKHGGYIGFLNGITRYARSRGVTIVVAAGNDAIDLDHSGGLYQAFCSSGMVICVSATGAVDEPAFYSNYGTSSVDVAAPGGSYALDKEGKVILDAAGKPVFAWIWGGCSRTSLNYTPAVPPSEGKPGSDPKYTKSVCTTGLFISGAIGTSAASPHVAGLAALLVERLGRDPGLIRETLQATADDLGKPGADPHYGKGRINVRRALGL